MDNDKISLLDSDGREKYLSAEEVKRFLASCGKLPPLSRTYCMTLYFTGARRAEALALRRKDIDLVKRRVSILTLKQKRPKKKNGLQIKTLPPPSPSWRRVPVPDEYLQIMDLVFDLRRGNGDGKMWNVTTRQVTRWVKTAMADAGMPHHSPHSLRHTFGVMAAMRGVPLPSIQKWLGHSHSSTTSIYTTAGGAEEDELMERMWG